MVAASTVLGAAGEHCVMCQLLRRGLIAALAPVGVPNCVSWNQLYLLIRAVEGVRRAA